MAVELKKSDLEKQVLVNCSRDGGGRRTGRCGRERHILLAQTDWRDGLRLLPCRGVDVVVVIGDRA